MIRNIKYLLTGAMVGGAIGSKVAVLLSSTLGVRFHFSHIEIGLAYGALFGSLLISAVILYSSIVVSKVGENNVRVNFKLNKA